METIVHLRFSLTRWLYLQIWSWRNEFEEYMDTFPEEPTSISAPWVITICNSGSRRSIVLFWYCMHVCVYIYRQNTCTQNNNKWKPPSLRTFLVSSPDCFLHMLSCILDNWPWFYIQCLRLVWSLLPPLLPTSPIESVLPQVRLQAPIYSI